MIIIFNSVFAEQLGKLWKCYANCDNDNTFNLPQAFSRNGRPTITARDSRFQNAMGNRDGLSFKDIALANKIYGCASGM